MKTLQTLQSEFDSEYSQLIIAMYQFVQIYALTTNFAVHLRDAIHGF